MFSKKKKKQFANRMFKLSFKANVSCSYTCPRTRIVSTDFPVSVNLNWTHWSPSKKLWWNQVRPSKWKNIWLKCCCRRKINEEVLLHQKSFSSWIIHISNIKAEILRDNVRFLCEAILFFQKWKWDWNNKQLWEHVQSLDNLLDALQSFT